MYGRSNNNWWKQCLRYSFKIEHWSKSLGKNNQKIVWGESMCYFEGVIMYCENYLICMELSVSRQLGYIIKIKN